MTSILTISADCRQISRPFVGPDREYIDSGERQAGTSTYATAWQQQSGFFTERLTRQRGDIIKRRDPLILAETATVQTACRMMRNRRIGAVLVIAADTGKRLIGLFTGRDAVERVMADALDPATTLLYRVMTVGPTVLGPEAPAEDALKTMRNGGFRHLPVIDGSHIVALVSRGDFIGAERMRLDEQSGFWEFLPEAPT